jgi:aspartate/methionine/tyrosine aminotransferase
MTAATGTAEISSLRVNPLVAGVAPPPIPEARAWASRYDGRHGPLIDLTQAVPGYPAHPELVRRLAEAAGKPESFRYGEITGDLALRGAYAADLNALYRGDIRPDEVAITTGANMGSFAATMLLAKPGEAVMLPVPWYFNHQMNTAMLGVEVVPLPCRRDDGFVPDPEAAERLLTDCVKAILLVTPNNPTGAIYPPETIARFADLCRRRGIALVLDETYRDFRPADLARPHELFAEPAWRDHLIQLYSFSKSYCVPGFRLGAIAASTPVLAQLTKILDCVQICAARAGQAGLAWAIPALTDWRERNRTLMNGRGAAAEATFATLPGWAMASRGAYFAYVRHPYPDHPAMQVAEALAIQRGVVTLPGSAFGPDQERYLRLAFANVEADRIAEVAERLKEPLAI